MKYLILALFLGSCEGSISWREKHGLIKSFDSEYLIQSIRVDDDAQYHVTAISKSNGLVKSFNDLTYMGYNTDDVTIRYSNTTEPILYIRYSDYQEQGNFYRDCSVPLKIILPLNYKIDTFED